jgi:hypothetical protein
VTAPRRAARSRGSVLCGVGIARGTGVAGTAAAAATAAGRKGLGYSIEEYHSSINKVVPRRPVWQRFDA